MKNFNKAGFFFTMIPRGATYIIFDIFRFLVLKLAPPCFATLDADQPTLRQIRSCVLCLAPLSLRLTKQQKVKKKELRLLNLQSMMPWHELVAAPLNWQPNTTHLIFVPSFASVVPTLENSLRGRNKTVAPCGWIIHVFPGRPLNVAWFPGCRPNVVSAPFLSARLSFRTGRSSTRRRCTRYSQHQQRTSFLNVKSRQRVRQVLQVDLRNGCAREKEFPNVTNKFLTRLNKVRLCYLKKARGVKK